jgi:hypothetical protein
MTGQGIGKGPDPEPTPEDRPPETPLLAPPDQPMWSGIPPTVVDTAFKLSGQSSRPATPAVALPRILLLSGAILVVIGMVRLLPSVSRDPDSVAVLMIGVGVTLGLAAVFVRRRRR